MAKRDPATLRPREVPKDKPPPVVEPLPLKRGAQSKPAEAAKRKAKRPAKTDAPASAKVKAQPPEQPASDIKPTPASLRREVDELLAYIAERGMGVMELPERDGMARYLLPEARGGWFGLVLVLAPRATDPRKPWSEPIKPWWRTLTANGYHVAGCYGAPRARDEIEHYLQYLPTPRLYPEED